MPRPGRPATTSSRGIALRRTTGQALGAVILVGALIGTAGCGPDATPAGPPPTTASVGPPPSTPAAASTPDPTSPDDRYAAPADAYVMPDRPAILDGPPSEDAAIAFAEYYLRLYTYAYLTGDAAELNTLGETGCIYCQRAAADIAREYGGHGHDEGGSVSIESASAIDYHSDGFFVVELHGDQSPVREVDATGATVMSNPVPTSYAYSFALYWHDGGDWRVGEVGVKRR